MFASKDVHGKRDVLLGSERKNATWVILCLKKGGTPPPTLGFFAEGISCWNVTIAMQSAPQLPNMPVGVRGKTFSRLSRQRLEIATRFLGMCGRAQRAVSTRVGLIVIQYMSFSTQPFPHSPRMVPV